MHTHVDCACTCVNCAFIVLQIFRHVHFVVMQGVPVLITVCMPSWPHISYQWCFGNIGWSQYRREKPIYIATYNELQYRADKHMQLNHTHKIPYQIGTYLMMKTCMTTLVNNTIPRPPGRRRYYGHQHGGN